MKSRLALTTVFALALVAPAAFPCGAPFGAGINVDPKQDIIVVHKNGTETYVFQPRFCGSARDFGLVLPVPAMLSAQPTVTTTDAFTKLVALSQPQYQYTTACLTGRGTGGGMADAGLPNSGGTTVVSSGRVGIMDYAQLDTVSVDAMTAWLTQNGYPYDAQATATFNYYVQKGWYFLTFKVDQGVADAGASTCKDLGPVKFSFPTSIPVVPTRMATARGKDASGTLSYATGFSWHIFGITDGSQQFGFADATTRSHVTLDFSGLISASDVASMSGLAAAGDRATKLTASFSYGSTDPDIALNLTTGQDYRQVITQVSYVVCPDGGTDSGRDVGSVSPDVPFPVDAPADLASPPADGARDLAPPPADVARPADAAPAVADAKVITPTPPDAGAPDLHADAAPANPDLGAVVVADASVAKGDAGATTTVPPPAKHSDGCCFAASSGTSGIIPTLVIGLLLALRRRRR